MADMMSGAIQGGTSGAMTGNPYLMAGGAIIGGLEGMFGGGGASDAAAQASAQQLQLQQQMYQQQDPFSAGGNRQQYVSQLNQLAQGGPASVQFDPHYQAIQDVAYTDMQRKEAAGGFMGSGKEKSELMDMSGASIMDYYNQQFNRLAMLSGASGGRTAPLSSGVSPTQAYGMQMNQYASQGQGFGMLMSGLSNIFGTPSTGGGQGGPG